MKPIRTAVLGLGRMGWGTHVKPLSRDDRYAIVALADSLAVNRKRAADECGCRTFEDAGHLIRAANELELELIVNVLPSHLHVGVGTATLEAGVHTVIEKPLAPDTAGAEALMAAAERAGRHLFVHHNRRFDPRYCTLQQVIARGALGRVFHLSLNLHGVFMRRNDWQTLQGRNGGLLRNHGTHWIDLALYALDEPVADVWGDGKLVCAAGDAEDHVKILFRTESGCLVDITCSTACHVGGAIPEIVAYGTAGTLVSDAPDRFTLRSFDPAAQPALDVDLGPQQRYAGRQIDLTEEIIEVHQTDTGGSYYDNVAAVLREGAVPRVTWSQVLDVHRVIDAVSGAGVADWRPPHYVPAPRPAAGQPGPPQENEGSDPARGD